VRIVDPNNAAVAVEPIGDESIPVMWDLVEPENTFAHLDTEVFVRHCPGADGHGVFDSEGHLMNWWATLIPNAGGVVSLRSGFPAPGAIAALLPLADAGPKTCRTMTIRNTWLCFRRSANYFAPGRVSAGWSETTQSRRGVPNVCPGGDQAPRAKQTAQAPVTRPASIETGKESNGSELVDQAKLAWGCGLGTVRTTAHDLNRNIHRHCNNPPTVARSERRRSEIDRHSGTMIEREANASTAYCPTMGARTEVSARDIGRINDDGQAFQRSNRSLRRGA